MINWMRSIAYTSTLYETAQTAYAAEERVPDSLRDFLGRLRLLYGVPFNYLVPDSRLLPVESIRFFYIDRNFTDRLVDGALSVGKTTTREFLHAQQMHADVKRRVDDEERVLRRRLRTGEAGPSVVRPHAAELTGMLLRSRAVSGWPGLEIKAFRGTSRQTPTGTGEKLALLRMDRLAPDVMLCIFEGVPSRLDIEEPSEGIQFGVDLHGAREDGTPTPDAQFPGGFKVKLRFLRGPRSGQQMGPNDTTPIDVAVPVRRSNRRVVHVAALRDALTTALRATGEIHADPNAALTAGEFALQLVQFPFRQRFEDDGDPKTGSGPSWVSGSQYVNTTLHVSVIAQPLTTLELQVLFPAHRG